MLNNKKTYIYLIILIVSIFTIGFGMLQTNFKNEKDYSNFSKEWYYNNEEITLSDIYKYDEVVKTLPILETDTQVYMNVKNINIDVYVEDELIYEHKEYNKDFFGKTPGSYFVKLDLKREYSGKQLILKIYNVYNDDSGKITEIYLGDTTDAALEFVKDHLLEFIMSSIIIFIGIILMTVFIILQRYKIMSLKALYLGMFALIIGVLMMMDCQILQFINGNAHLYNMISNICMTIVVVPIILFIDRAYRNTSNKTVADILCAIGFLNFIVCYILNMFNIYDYHQTLLITYITYLLCIIYIIYLTIKSTFNKEYKEMYHTFGLVCICIGTILDIIMTNMTTIIATSFFTRLGVLIFLSIEGVISCVEFLRIYRHHERTTLLHKLAYEDGLTELLNRTSFMEDMEKYKNIKTGLIAIFDINDLKKVNDEYGHTEGDNLIVTITDNIKECILNLGKCYRIGGDEFVFISTKNVEKEFNEAYKKLIKNLNKYNKSKYKEYKVSLAMGYSVIDQKTSIEKAFNIADSNMYKNKKQIKSKK